ncbi:hypothetical protein MKW92_010665 [Papaver armeniacum]|nr:hypothetical protein MKW92_010665 [Papaver armeniacum]
MVVHSWFRTVLARRRFWNGRDLMTRSFPFINDARTRLHFRSPGTVGFCGLAKGDSLCSYWIAMRIFREDVVVDALPVLDSDEDISVRCGEYSSLVKEKLKVIKKKSIVEFSKVDADLLPTVILVGRPNVGKSALFNRFIQRREALVYNTPDDHVTRDIREGIAKLGDLRFRVTSGSILDRTTGMTRDGLQPLDFEVGSWLLMNKSQSLYDHRGYLMSPLLGEAYKLGYGDTIAISAETGLGMGDLYDSLRPLLEEYMLRVLNGKSRKASRVMTPLPRLTSPSYLCNWLSVGRPNVGKSTMPNALLQQNVFGGTKLGLTRDSVRAEFQYEGRTVVYCRVDTAGWLQRSAGERTGVLECHAIPKNLMRAHVIALVLDEMRLVRRAVEEGRGLVVIVNKMDLLSGKENAKLYEKVIKAVREEIQTEFRLYLCLALEGKGRIAIMRQVMETYEKWCLRLSIARLNRWLCKVMSRHSWRDQKAKPKIKYFTQVKARPPTFVAFIRGKTEFSDTDIRFLTRSLKEDFDLGGIPIRIMQTGLCNKSCGRMTDKIISTREPYRLTRFPRQDKSRFPNTNHLGSYRIAPCDSEKKEQDWWCLYLSLGSKQAGRGHISLMALSCVRHGQVVAVY